MTIEKYLKFVCPYTNETFSIQDRDAFSQHIKKQERKKRQNELKQRTRDTIAAEIKMAAKTSMSWENYVKTVKGIADSHSDKNILRFFEHVKKLTALDTPTSTAQPKLITTTHSAPEGKPRSKFFNGPTHKYLALCYPYMPEFDNVDIKQIHVHAGGSEVFGSDFKHIAATIVAMAITKDPSIKDTLMQIQMSVFEKKEGDYVQTIEDLANEMFGWSLEKYQAIADISRGLTTSQCVNVILEHDGRESPQLDWYEPV